LFPVFDDVREQELEQRVKAGEPVPPVLQR